MRYLAVFCLLATPSLAAGPVTLTSLLEEMVDREAIARFPDPAYTCRQFSSYDRKSKSPTEDWFANGDANQFLRQETNDGRTEWVLMDTAGPGAIVRFWSANPPEGSIIRIYLDESTEPSLAEPFPSLLNGSGMVAAPLSAERSRGWNLYLPIPYARHCKVTCDKRGFYYQLNYRTYAPGTAVESFTRAGFEAARPTLDRVQRLLLAPRVEQPGLTYEDTVQIAPGQTVEQELLEGSRVIREIRVRVVAADVTKALRSLVAEVEFDGERCIWAPLGDAFGSGVGRNVFQDWWRTIDAEGWLTLRWPMPYRTGGVVRLHNLGDQAADVDFAVVIDNWTWDDRSMHFRVTWRHQYPIHTEPKHDWNYLEATGQGVYVGDTLAVMNPVSNWWGEGDEKIYVDGETFPSHFGTGTEDYYGYAWCSPRLFTGPFHAQPRCDGPGNFGHTTVSRVRLLDGIPFTRSFKFDMEVWHWKECDVAYAATCYWYARPGATSNRAPQPEEAARPIPSPPPPFVRANHQEAESAEIVALSEGLPYEVQPTAGYEHDGWSGNQHLWVRGRRLGDFIELRFKAPDDRPHKLIYYGTKSWDYGILKITVNGREPGLRLDGYSEKVVKTGPLELGEFTPVDGAYVLRIEVIEHHPAARGSKSFFGLDGLEIVPAG